MSSNSLLSITAVLLFSTISVLIIYYRRIKTLRQEYEMAKGTVNDVVVSVGSQFRKHERIVHFVAKQVEKISIENKKVVEKVKNYDNQIAELMNRINDPPHIEEKFSGQLNDVKNEFKDIKETQENLMKKLIAIEKIKQEAYVPELNIAAAIPIKKEKALAPLTDTELMVLETIRKEGEKTAPEIREKIGLTREHSARLMKKLYKDGYLERNTHKMPYIYRLKEEMRKILRKRELSTS